MKRPSLLLLLLPAVMTLGGAERIQKRTPGPAEVYGRIQFACPDAAPEGKRRRMNALADVKVQVVTALPDLRVKRVNALASNPGEWQIACPGVAPEGGRRRMDSLPDYTVQIVDSLPDFTIQWVDAFPGER